MKKKPASKSAFFNCRHLAVWFLFSIAVPVALYAFGVFPPASGSAQAGGQSENSDMSGISEREALEHITWAGARFDLRASGEEMAQSGVASTPVMAATRSSFLANWNSVSGAIGYRLDVSASGSFDSYVDGYQALDVGNVTFRIVSGLSPGTTYYYRVRAYNSVGESSHSNVMAVTTATVAGLVITPSYDAAITGNAEIQAMIVRAIAIYQSLFSDMVDVKIHFRYATDQPNGNPLPANALAQSLSAGYLNPWASFITPLVADAKTANDATANANLPASPLATNISASTANGRAIAGRNGGAPASGGGNSTCFLCAA